LSGPYCTECGKEMRYMSQVHFDKNGQKFVDASWVCVDCKTVSNAPPPQQTAGEVLIHGSRDPVARGLRTMILVNLVWIVVALLIAVWWWSLFR